MNNDLEALAARRIEQGPPRVWVDYNGLDEHDRVTTLLRYVDGIVNVGSHVMTFDGEGNECSGRVTAIDPPMLQVAIDRAGFRQVPVNGKVIGLNRIGE